MVQVLDELSVGLACEVTLASFEEAGTHLVRRVIALVLGSLR